MCSRCSVSSGLSPHGCPQTCRGLLNVLGPQEAAAPSMGLGTCAPRAVPPHSVPSFISISKTCPEGQGGSVSTWGGGGTARSPYWNITQPGRERGCDTPRCEGTLGTPCSVRDARHRGHMAWAPQTGDAQDRRLETGSGLGPVRASLGTTGHPAAHKAVK